MSLTYSQAVRNARLDAIESTTGTAPLLRIYSGTPPSSARASLSGNTLLAEGSLPSDWMAAASSGAKSKTGTWTLTGQSGAGAGTPGTFFRIYDSGGATCHIQGLFGEPGSPNVEMTISVNSIENGGSYTVSTFDIAARN